MSKYVFDPDVIHECAIKGVGQQNKPAMFDCFADALEEQYPGVVDRTQPWLFSIAGGAMIQMKLYFASLTEYVMIWGTPIGSIGFSGRHFSGFWDTVLDGEAWYFAEGEFEKTRYCPGDRIYVGPGHARGMNFTNGIWAVEYARGYIPLSIPFGLADVVISCTDVLTAAQTITLYTDLVCQHIGRTLEQSAFPLGGLASQITGTISRTAARLTHWITPPAPFTEIPKDNPPWQLGTSSALTEHCSPCGCCHHHEEHDVHPTAVQMSHQGSPDSQAPGAMA